LRVFDLNSSWASTDSARIVLVQRSKEASRIYVISVTNDLNTMDGMSVERGRRARAVAQSALPVATMIASAFG
jgi:glyceraldehyde-3-phosphate dehydrogenase/erythrose-4-phosphate dehydrogenase